MQKTHLNEQSISIGLLAWQEQIEILPPEQHGPRLCFQVFCNGMPIGHARLEKCEAALPIDGKVIDLLEARLNSLGRPTYVLKMIQIAQNYRNRGIGTLLMKEVLHYCRNHHIHRLTGEIKGDMALLRHWYSRNGFRIAGEDRLEIHLN